MNSCEIVSLVTAIACTIAKCTPKEDVPIIAAIFGELGATLATITVIQEASENQQPIPEITPPDTSIITVPLAAQQVNQ
ncbi:MAG TPA: hypothetical protein VN258_02345 [Mobilitalea sp.]|nr:hypothetical protein [Mobilitalea sp.]